MDNVFDEKGEDPLKNAIFKTWHNISQQQGVKKSITYREITLAIGIVVALVIALTLWTSVPDSKVSGSGSSQELTLPSAGRNLFKTTIGLFHFQLKNIR